ncbi:hypothetical protein VT52_025770 [Streptomyces malaysiense]|uniref:Uncharacterized protein n=1 Tax=Streptomyces malaysiense TaxID=1428626 RepID=A0A1J4PUX0_9ACTN|nr:hypothetical protein VT52_025770 [Streptomyces malaysiense]
MADEVGCPTFDGHVVMSYPEGHVMGQGDAGAATVEDLGAATLRGPARSPIAAPSGPPAALAEGSGA